MVKLFGSSTAEFGEVGRLVPAEFRRLKLLPPESAWDFLAIALAVSAADTLIPRGDGADGWTRVIELSVDLRHPELWGPHKSELEEILAFLSGDYWSLTFQDGGSLPPGTRTASHDVDCVSLFSGGLDSYVGVVDFVAQGKLPLLVSQAYPKEQSVQLSLAKRVGKLPPPLTHFSVDAAPSHPTVQGNSREESMRTRSLLFIAYGVAISAALKIGTLYVPENGFIALNPPLTARRIGSLSTRTTHPFFLTRLEALLGRVGLPIGIANPYAYSTKGEMLQNCANQGALRKCFADTVSCGKWKRQNQQCGRCVPCIIRRSAIRASDLRDSTSYKYPTLTSQAGYDDVLAFRAAVARSSSVVPERWLLEAAPLPNTADRSACAGVIARGLDEVAQFLSDQFA